MKHFNGIETFIPNGKMLGPITQFLLNQNVGLNLAPSLDTPSTFFMGLFGNSIGLKEVKVGGKQEI